jgi:hypothetical protein
MKQKQLLNGSYWFTMYTTYIAILSLLYYILENPESATTKDGVLKDALEGKNALAGLAKRSMAADRCTQSLNVGFPHSNGCTCIDYGVLVLTHPLPLPRPFSNASLSDCEIAKPQPRHY